MLLSKCFIHPLFKSLSIEGVYDKEFKQSIENPSEYWAKIAEETIWSKKWDKVLDDGNSPFTKWFPGGRLSLCYNAVDRHVDEGRGQTKALVWDSPITNQKSVRNYSELQMNVSTSLEYTEGVHSEIISLL